jgi:hypothetical protein
MDGGYANGEDAAATFCSSYGTACLLKTLFSISAPISKVGQTLLHRENPRQLLSIIFGNEERGSSFF